MSGKPSRQKGCRGELEVLKILQQFEQDLETKRELSQWQGSDCDLRRWGWAFEIKRQETLSLRSWWNQAVAACDGDIPAVIYRQSRQPWRVIFTPWAISPLYPSSDIANPDPDDFDYAITMLLEPAFIEVLRIRDEMEDRAMLIEGKLDVASNMN